MSEGRSSMLRTVLSTTFEVVGFLTFGVFLALLLGPVWVLLPVAVLLVLVGVGVDRGRS